MYKGRWRVTRSRTLAGSQPHRALTANHIYEMTLRHFWIHYLTPQRGRRGANTPPLCEVTHCSSGSPRSRPTGLPWGDTCYSSSNFANSRIEFAKSIWWSTGHEVGSSSAASNPLPWATLSQARRLVVWGVYSAPHSHAECCTGI